VSEYSPDTLLSGPDLDRLDDLAAQDEEAGRSISHGRQQPCGQAGGTRHEGARPGLEGGPRPVVGRARAAAVRPLTWSALQSLDVFQRAKDLFRNFVVYGIGDVATSLVGFFLLYVFTRILSTADYGVLYLLLTVELIAKLIFRWGIDASFMRLYYDCHDEAARQRLASTLFFFLVAVNGTILAVALALAPLLAGQLFGAGRYTFALQLVLANTFLGSFYFIPFHLLRIQGRAAQFGVLAFSRSIGTILLRVLLVAGLGMGVLGMVLADVCMTVGLAPVLARWLAPSSASRSRGRCCGRRCGSGCRACRTGSRSRWPAR